MLAEKSPIMCVIKWFCLRNLIGCINKRIFSLKLLYAKIWIMKLKYIRILFTRIALLRKKGANFATAYELIYVGGGSKRGWRRVCDIWIWWRLNQILSQDNFRIHYEITSEEENLRFISEESNFRNECREREKNFILTLSSRKYITFKDIELDEKMINFHSLLAPASSSENLPSLRSFLEEKVLSVI